MDNEIMDNEITDNEIMDNEITNNELVKKAHDNLFKNNDNNYIFIYTPPKVGSTTLVSSLRICLGKKYNIIHIHDEVMLSVLSGIKNVTINELIKYISGMDKNVWVIDVYRLPIERKMSEFFEKISSIHFNNTEKNVNQYDINRISNRFNELFPHLSSTEHYFDKYNIENPIQFDFNKKYTVEKHNGINYIKLRLMDSDKWSGILSQILNEKILIVNDYQTSDKEIRDLYNRFKKEYKLPINFYEEIKNCKYFNFYLSEEERNEYLKLWEPKISYEEFIPFTYTEYQFYIKISLENQYYDNIQYEHYIDNGCFCKACNIKRRKIYFKLLKNEVFNNEKIIHNNEVQNMINKTTKIILPKPKPKQNIYLNYNITGIK
jgi:hypothetical protein